MGFGLLVARLLRVKLLYLPLKLVDLGEWTLQLPVQLIDRALKLRGALLAVRLHLGVDRLDEFFHRDGGLFLVHLRAHGMPQVFRPCRGGTHLLEHRLDLRGGIIDLLLLLLKLRLLGLQLRACGGDLRVSLRLRVIKLGLARGKLRQAVGHGLRARIKLRLCGFKLRVALIYLRLSGIQLRHGELLLQGVLVLTRSELIPAVIERLLGLADFIRRVVELVSRLALGFIYLVQSLVLHRGGANLLAVLADLLCLVLHLSDKVLVGGRIAGQLARARDGEIGDGEHVGVLDRVAREEEGVLGRARRAEAHGRGVRVDVHSVAHHRGDGVGAAPEDLAGLFFRVRSIARVRGGRGGRGTAALGEERQRIAHALARGISVLGGDGDLVGGPGQLALHHLGLVEALCGQRLEVHFLAGAVHARVGGLRVGALRGVDIVQIRQRIDVALG